MKFKLGIVVGGGIAYLIASGSARELLGKAKAAMSGGRKDAAHTVDAPTESSESTPWPSHAGGPSLAPVT